MADAYLFTLAETRSIGSPRAGVEHDRHGEVGHAAERMSRFKLRDLFRRPGVMTVRHDLALCRPMRWV